MTDAQAHITIHAPDHIIVDAFPVHWPPTAADSARVQRALKLANETGLRPTTLCLDCLEDRLTGELMHRCKEHGGE